MLNKIKKFYYNMPKDILLLLGVYVLCAILVMFFDLPPLIFWCSFVAVMGYLILCVVVARKRYGKFRYIMLIIPFFSKKTVYISMCKSKCKPNVGNHSVEGEKADWTYMREMAYLVKVLPKGTICVCCTHDIIVKAIKRVADVVTIKKVYKDTLKVVKKYLGKKDTGEKVQFYKVRFMIR